MISLGVMSAGIDMETLSTIGKRSTLLTLRNLFTANLYFNVIQKMLLTQCHFSTSSVSAFSTSEQGQGQSYLIFVIFFTLTHFQA